MAAAGAWFGERTGPDGVHLPAVLTFADHCVWGGWPDAPLPGGDLVAGRLFVLTAGRAEVTLARGAKVHVEGPATFEPAGADECVLHAGRVVAHVPPTAVEFAVRTPALRVVDLGTDFGVEIDPAGAATVGVRTGTVDAGRTGAGEPATRLGAGQGSRLKAGGLAVFLERAGVVVPPDAEVDVVRPEKCSRHEDLTPQTLPAGSRADTYLIQAQFPTGGGSVTFAAPVPGLVTNDTRLTAGDTALGAPGSKYSPSPLRGVGFVQGWVELSPDRRTVSVMFDGASLDQVRVLVSAPGD